MTEDAGWEERDRLKERRKSETIGLNEEREREREREGTGGEGKEKTRREKYRKPSGAGTPASKDL